MNTLPYPPANAPSVEELARRSAQLRANLDSTLDEIAQRATQRRPGVLSSMGLALAGAFWRRRRK